MSIINIDKSTEIARRMLSTFLANQSEITDILPATPLQIIFEQLFARELETLTYNMITVMNAFYIKEAPIEALELAGADYGLERQDAINASGILKITGDVGTTIPSGTTFQRPQTTNQTQVIYSTSRDYVIPSGGIVYVEVEASIEGTIGNTASGTITQLVDDSIPEISAITNENPFNSGAEQETVEDFRDAIIEYWESLARGTKYAIEYISRRTEGVYRVILKENTPYSGRGILYVDIGSSIHSNTIEDSIYTTITGDGTVNNKGYIPINSKIDIEFKTGSEFDELLVEEEAVSNVQPIGVIYHA